MPNHCAICGKEIAENDACIGGMRTKQPFCSDRCSKAYLLVKCLWCFAGKKTGLDRWDPA